MKYLTCLLLLLWALPLQAAQPTITELLNAAARQPELKAGRLAVQGTDIQLKQARAALYPKLSVFGSYEMYNSPTNLRPMPPTEINIAAGDSIPFSKRIARYGVRVEMPLFVKELYSLADKVKKLKKSSRARYRIELLTRQAQVVSLEIDDHEVLGAIFRTPKQSREISRRLGGRALDGGGLGPITFESEQKLGGV